MSPAVAPGGAAARHCPGMFRIDSEHSSGQGGPEAGDPARSMDKFSRDHQAAPGKGGPDRLLVQSLTLLQERLSASGRDAEKAWTEGPGRDDGQHRQAG